MKDITEYKPDAITVITVTRNRVALLHRAICSVKNQTFEDIRHLIVIDDCQKTLDFLNENYREDSRVLWKYYQRIGNDSVPSRLAVLRNWAIYNVQTEYFCFLDDDNEFYPGHLQGLFDFAKIEKCTAVHSYREVLYNDGMPYLEALSPWGRNEGQRRAKYRELLDAGVAVEGSNIWRDKYGITIDTNVWLIETAIFQDISISEEYSKADWENVVPEDMKLMGALMAHKVEVKTNQKPTVKYYLGGYSNDCGDTEGTEDWV